ncbi:MAG: hypothetical protein ABUT20_20650, partial [Bacteroidota bacterium]
MKKLILYFFAFCSVLCVHCQQLSELIFNDSKPFEIKEIKAQGKITPVSIPYFSLEINKKLCYSNSSLFWQEFSDRQLHLLINPDTSFKDGYGAKLVFSNNGKSPVLISNIVPFGATDDHYFIAGKQFADTSRSFLFQPGHEPVGVVVPHNNNDLCFTAVELDTGKTFFGLIKRSDDSIQNYLLYRSPYMLEPGKTISFQFYADIAEGDWHTALQKC